MLTLGTGVGGAVLVDGMILHGANGAAGHLGHTTIDPRGGLCICGNYGCLETHFSSRAIESEYWAHMHRAAPTKLTISNTGEVFQASVGQVIDSTELNATRNQGVSDV